MKVTLAAWAKQFYDPPPSIHTLRQWVRNGEIHPPAELVGRNYYVNHDAKRLGGSTTKAPERGMSLVDRIKANERQAA